MLLKIILSLIISLFVLHFVVASLGPLKFSDFLKQALLSREAFVTLTLGVFFYAVISFLHYIINLLFCL